MNYSFKQSSHSIQRKSLVRYTCLIAGLRIAPTKSKFHEKKKLYIAKVNF